MDYNNIFLFRKRTLNGLLKVIGIQIILFYKNYIYQMFVCLIQNNLCEFTTHTHKTKKLFCSQNC